MKKILLVAVVGLVAASFAVAEAEKAEAAKAKEEVCVVVEKAAVKCVVCDKACDKPVEVKAGEKTLCVCCDACAKKVSEKPEEFVKKAEKACAKGDKSSCEDKPAKSDE